jgi:transposase
MIAPPIPKELWDRTPADVQSAIAKVFLAQRRRIDELEAQLRDLEARIRTLEARLRLDSTNSSKPPSSGPVGVKRKPPEPRSGRKRGGQPGRPLKRRALVPPEQVDAVVVCKPDACRRCRRPLAGDDPEPLVHQVAELPPVAPRVVEYRLHRLVCPRCRMRTCGGLPAGVPRGAFGPRLQAVLAMFAGACRLSKGQIRRLAADLLGLSISTGMVAKLERASAAALQGPYDEAAVAIHEAGAAYVDETPWRQERRRAWLWTAAARLATVFAIAPKRSGAIARALVGTRDSPIVVSDRCTVYDWIAPARRQVCWAHLRRDFQAMIDRQDAGSAVGATLLKHSTALFHAWREVRAETRSRASFQREAARLRRRVHRTLRRGLKCTASPTAATCWELLKLEPSLWTFARVEGVEPTNNAAERALRHAVIWRRTSGGTDSEAGSRFVERMLTVVATCRQHGRSVLDYLTACFEARLAHCPLPSLLHPQCPRTVGV